MNSYKNILIIKPSALGDIVHALPVLEALRTSIPTARITWLVRKEFAPLLECVEGLDEILLFDRKQLGYWYYRPAAFKALRNFIHTLKDRHYDLVLDLQGLFRTGLFSWMTGCQNRIGMADCRELASLFYTLKVPAPDNSVHVLDYYFAALKAVGFEPVLNAGVSFNISDETTASIKRKLKLAGINENYLVLVPSSAHQSKCWAPERFAAMAEKLHHEYGHDIVAVGTQKDKLIVQKIQKHCALPIADLTGQTSIKELVAIFYQAAAVISNDTGPGYIAAETGVPTVIIYGNVNPLRVAPYIRPECIVAIEPDRKGEKGIRTNNPKHNIQNVTCEMVWDKITTQLKSMSKE